MPTLFLTLLAALLILGGCSVDESGNGGFDLKESSHPKRSQYRTFISDEELKTQKELALIEANKTIALGKIQSEAELERLKLEKEKALALLKEKERLLAIEHQRAMERYMLIGAMLALLLVGTALLWYFDKRRKDKLKAYEDNLQKYFHQKELEARTKIAEKILDTVASGKLDMEQKNKLIEALHGPIAKPQEPQPKEGETPVIANRKIETENETIDIEPEETRDGDRFEK